mmetsp:Transcript_14066/g.21244  ORF Transcript_14066/g.21244 Transcript_14066/m.21244 type:complete len:110 (-) Transcript_14066:73-402(-)
MYGFPFFRSSLRCIRRFRCSCSTMLHCFCKAEEKEPATKFRFSSRVHFSLLVCPLTSNHFNAQRAKSGHHSTFLARGGRAASLILNRNARRLLALIIMIPALAEHTHSG